MPEFDGLDCRAEDFSLPPGLHYLNCAYMAPQPRRVEAAGLAALTQKRDPTLLAPTDFFTGSDLLRSRFARLIHADAERIAIVPAVSYGMAIAARHLLRDGVAEPGMNVVVAADQFPSNVLVWRKRAARLGVEVRTVAAPEGAGRGAGWSTRILESIDGATAAVAIGHVHWMDGTRFDLHAIGARAREVGAALAVDGTQSLGALPFDVAEIQPDLLVAAGYKWLLGPYALGLAYLGPRFDDAEPLEETWLGRSGSEEFRDLTRYEDRYRPGAARFDVGERSNFVLVPMLSEALAMLLEWRPERIQGYCAELISPLVDAAAELGYRVEDAAWRGAHMFGLRVPPGGDLPRLLERLAESRISVSVRGDSVRVSPHLYNGEDDIGALIEVLRAVA